MVENRNELSIGVPGLQVTVACEGDAWAVTRAAFEAARKAAEEESFSAVSLLKDSSSTPPRAKTKAERMREVARRVLADGRVHERREITKAVREAGLPAQQLDAALRRDFVRDENVLGRPTYRDPSVTPAPSREIRPDYARDLPPGTGTPRLVGTLNGHGHD